MTAECGPFSVVAPFDPTLVETVEGTCTIPSEVAPNEQATYSVEVVNPNESQGARFTVSFAAVDLPNEPAVLRVDSQVGAGSQVPVEGSFIPENLNADLFPETWESNIRAVIVPGSVEPLSPSAPVTNEPAKTTPRTGATARMTVRSDGGTPATARAPTANGCGCGDSNSPTLGRVRKPFKQLLGR